MPRSLLLLFALAICAASFEQASSMLRHKLIQRTAHPKLTTINLDLTGKTIRQRL
jgi:hypothetical protein